MYTYPSKEVEVLIIKSDSTFIKNLYPNEQDFRNNSNIKYANNGSWFLIKDGELVFRNWLMINNLRNPEDILDKPIFVTMHDVIWMKNRPGHNPLISVSEEMHYEFEKISDASTLR